MRHVSESLKSSSVSRASRVWGRLFSAAIVAYLVVWAAGFVFVSRVFGLYGALALALVPILPLVIAVRLRRRWPSVRVREFASLAALLVVASGSVVGVVRN